MTKITKRQIKEDKFVTGLLRSQQLFNQYRTQIFMGAGALLVVAIVIAFFISSSHSAAKQAEDELGLANMKIRDFYNAFESDYDQDGSPDHILDSNVLILQDARTEYENIMKEHPGSDAAKFACFHLAAISFKLGDFQKAQEYYQTFLKKYYIDDVFEAAAKYGLANTKETLREFEEAGNLFLEISQKYEDFPQRGIAAYKATINLARAGLGDQALTAFEMLEDIPGAGTEAYEARIFLFEKEILDPYKYNLN